MINSTVLPTEAVRGCVMAKPAPTSPKPPPGAAAEPPAEPEAAAPGAKCCFCKEMFSLPPAPTARLGPAGAALLHKWENDLFLKCLTSFWRLEPDGEGFSGEGVLVPRLGVRVLVGLFH